MTVAPQGSTLASLVQRAAAALSHAHDNSVRDRPREARRFVAAVLDRSPAAVAMALARNESVPTDDCRRVVAAVERLAQGMPFAYAVGTAAFRHLLLQVDRRVLIPRPETELLVDHVLRLCADVSGGIAVDIGTGSGAIALALAQEGRFDRVIATDISDDALVVARGNADRLASEIGTVVEFRRGADLAPVLELPVSVLVSNPPYIAFQEAESLPALVRNWEPPTALFAAADGMARYAAILAQAPSVVVPKGWLVLECDANRAEQTLELVRGTGAFGALALHKDLAGRPRVLTAQRTG